jgi:beta-glucanase (GH16 family)
MPSFYGCERVADGTNIINPVASARLRTSNSFAFTYGRVETRAKLPAGDWLWPAIWMLPLNQEYGLWPTSGEIDIMESRGNLNLFDEGVNIGAEQYGSTLHYGVDYIINGWPKAHVDKNTAAGQGYDKDFHTYGVNIRKGPILKQFYNYLKIGGVDPGKVYVQP